MGILLVFVSLALAAAAEETCGPTNFGMCNSDEQALLREFMALAPSKLSQRLSEERRALQTISQKTNSDVQALHKEGELEKQHVSKPFDMNLERSKLHAERQKWENDFRMKMAGFQEEQRTISRRNPKQSPFGVSMEDQQKAKRKAFGEVAQKQKKLHQSRGTFMQDFGRRMAELGRERPGSVQKTAQDNRAKVVKRQNQGTEDIELQKRKIKLAEAALHAPTHLKEKIKASPPSTMTPHDNHADRSAEL